MTVLVVLTVVVIVALIAGLAVYLYWAGTLLDRIGAKLEGAADIVRGIVADAELIEPGVDHINRTGGVVAGALPLLYTMAEGIVTGVTPRSRRPRSRRRPGLPPAPAAPGCCPRSASRRIPEKQEKSLERRNERGCPLSGQPHPLRPPTKSPGHHADFSGNAVSVSQASKTGGAGGPVVSQASSALTSGPGFFLERGKVRLLVNRTPALGCAGLQRAQQGRAEVLHVLGEQPPLLRGCPGEDLLVALRAQVGPVSHGQDVMAELPQFRRDAGREHLVEQ